MKKYRKYLLLLLLIGIITLAYVFDLHEFLTVEKVRGFVEQFGVFGPLAYMVLYFFAILLFLPATVFTVLAGVIFGKLLGSIYVVIPATLAAQTAFFIARFLGKGGVEKFIQGEKGTFQKLFTKVTTQVEENGFQAFFVLRCLFLPYIPLSYASGLVPKARPIDFFLATLLTNIIFTPAFVYFGEALTQGPKALLLPVALIIVVLLVPRVIQKFRNGKT